jgi:hypothetical protein
MPDSKALTQATIWGRARDENAAYFPMNCDGIIGNRRADSDFRRPNRALPKLRNNGRVSELRAATPNSEIALAIGQVGSTFVQGPRVPRMVAGATKI